MAATEAMGVTVKADFRDFEKALLRAQNQTDAKLHSMEKRFDRTNKNVRQQTSGLAAAAKGSLGELSAAVSSAGSGIPGLGGGMGKLGIIGAGAAIGVGSLALALRGVAESAKFAADLTDAADRIGVGVEALQELRFAADETGVDLAKLDAGLEALNGTLGAFKTGIGAGRIKPIFAALGLTQADLEPVQNANDLLPILADRLGQVDSRAEQVQLARKLGIEPLLPLLRQGSENLKRMADEGRSLGLVMSGDVVASLDATDRALEKNKQQIDANLRGMYAGLAPFFVWATDQLARLQRGIGDLFNGLANVESRNDRVLARRSEWLQGQVTAGRSRGLIGGGLLRNREQELERVNAEIGRRTRASLMNRTPGPSAAARAQEGFALVDPIPGAGGGGGRSRGGGGGRGAPAGPSPADLAAQREMLALEGKLALLRAQGKEDEADAVQRRVEIINLTKRLGDAGVANAEAEATAQVNAIAAAERFSDLQRRAAEGQKSLAADLIEQDRRRNDLLLDRMRYELTLARAAGDPVAIQLKERELYIAERINYLIEQRAGLITKAEAAAQAGGEFDAIASAERNGANREQFGRDFADGFRAAMDGELEEFAQNLADRFLDRSLERLGETLYDTVFGGFDAAAQGTAQGTAHAATVGPAIATAGVTAATAMGGAITTAGAAAAAAMAAAIATANAASVPFKFASGGKVRGPGTGTSDSIPAMLSNGEFVVRAAAAAKHMNLLQAINANAMQGFAGGGMVLATGQAREETVVAYVDR